MGPDEAYETSRRGERLFRDLVTGFRGNSTIERGLRLANLSGAPWPLYSATVGELEDALGGYGEQVRDAGRDPHQVRAALTHGYLTLEANVLPLLDEVSKTLRSAERLVAPDEIGQLRAAAADLSRVRGEAAELHRLLYGAFRSFV